MKLPAALLLVLLTATPTRSEPPPEQDFMLYCMGCHQRDGSGLSGRVPSLRSADRFLRPPGGRAYLVRVPGVANAALSNARLAALLNWVLAEFGDSEFRHYTAQEVGPLRAKPFINPAAARKTVFGGSIH
jgi:hypothetical protein